MPKLNLNVSVLSVFFWDIGAVQEKLKGPTAVNKSRDMPVALLITFDLI